MVESANAILILPMVLQREKYKQAILYLCRKLGGEVRGKKKLAKLLYFVDFDLFEKTETSLTGDTYKALPMGPFPSALEEMTSEMSLEKSLSVETVGERDGYIATEVYRSLVEPDVSLLGADERKMLDRVAIKYGHLNGKQLEELSHAEAPYIGTEALKEIPYELAFYRGTDFGEV